MVISHSHPAPNQPAPATSLLIWLAIQFLALALPVFQVPLSENYPRPAEQLAIQQLLVIQITAAALLFPLLARGTPCTLILAVTTLPFIQLAGLLSSTAWPRLALASAYLCLWLICLDIWHRLLTPNRQLLLTALASAFSLGGAILWYLRAEFLTNQPAPIWPSDGLLGPVLGALAVVNQQPLTVGPWLILVVPLACGLAILRLARWLPFSVKPH